jgi:hypothetical protein
VLAGLIAACGSTMPGEPLALRTAGFQLGLGGCASAALSPFRIERSGSEMVFTQPDVGRIDVVWPFGFQARLVDGKGVLYASDRTTIGIEGDVLSDVGGSGAFGDGFFVCSIGSREYR